MNKHELKTFRNIVSGSDNVGVRYSWKGETTVNTVDLLNDVKIAALEHLIEEEEIIIRAVRVNGKWRLWSIKCHHCKTNIKFSVKIEKED